MEIEQIISLLRIAGYILILPTGGFMVAVVAAIRNWRTEPKEESNMTAAVQGEEGMQAPPAKTTESQSQRLKLKKEARRSSGKMKFRKIPLKKEQLVESEEKEPAVSLQIPQVAQDSLEEIWNRFAPMPVTWRNMTTEEVVK